MAGDKNMDEPSTPFKKTFLTDKQFNQLAAFIKKELGIEMPVTKKTMLEARLQKRIRLLHLGSHDEYFNFLFSDAGMKSEYTHLVSSVTTNTTNFFREPKHFDILTEIVLPEIQKKKGRNAQVKLWSAGCSSGEEPYTLAMVMSEYKHGNMGFNFSINATDISQKVLQEAAKAIYSEDKIGPVPPQMKKKYLLRSKDRSKKLIRIVPELRRTINFGRLNFMDDFKLPHKFNIIFCRNVVIYFDRETQGKLFHKFCSHLEPGGFLFIGHSESVTGLGLPVEQIAPTVFRKI
ncbi:MAG: CheR family methyltransferase [Desulfovibrio sp.]